VPRTIALDALGRINSPTGRGLLYDRQDAGAVAGRTIPFLPIFPRLAHAFRLSRRQFFLNALADVADLLDCPFTVTRWLRPLVAPGNKAGYPALVLGTEVTCEVNE
jgi:hypothetical protein